MGNMINSRVRAGAVHLGVSFVIAAVAALIVFGLWYPYPYRELSGGRELFALIVVVDVVIGPLLTLMVFNARKSKFHLMMDISLIGLLQMAALLYGLWTVFLARPVYMVFEYHRMAIVHAVEIEGNALNQAPAAFRKIPMLGPELLSLRPLQPSEAIESILKAAGGLSQAAQPHLWQSYDAARDQILQESRPAAQLKERFANQARMIDDAVILTGRPLSKLRYLPLLARRNVWTVLIDSDSAQPVGFVEVGSF